MGEGSDVAVSCGAGHRRGLDPVLLWLWCRPVATALIRPLAWEPPYAAGAALEKAKKKRKDKGEEFYTVEVGRKCKKIIRMQYN